MDHTYAPLEIPELAEMIARALWKRDITQLCQVNKAFQNMYHPLLWTSISFKSEDYVNQQGQLSKFKGAIIKNLDLMQSVDIVSKNFDILRSLRPVPMNEETELYPPSQLKQQHRQRQLACTNLRYFSFTRSDNNLCPEKLLFKAANCLSSILSLNLRLTDLNLRSNVILYAQPESFLGALLSLVQLRRLTISTKTLYRMFPMLIDLAMKLLKSHQSLKELDLGDCQSGGSIGSPFLKERITEATMDIRALTRAEDEILSELEKSLDTSSEDRERVVEFPRLQRLAIPPRWCWNDYPLSFLESLLSACPNLSTLTVPNFDFSQASVLGTFLRDKCPHLTSVEFPKRVSGSFVTQVYIRKMCFFNVLQDCPLLTSIDAGFASMTHDKVEAMARHLPTLTFLKLENVLDLSMKDLHEILVAGRSLKVLEILEADLGFDREETRFHSEEWVCKGLEKLCVYDLRRPRSWFWQQVGRLEELRVLEIGDSKASGAPQSFELMLEDQAQAQQQHPGGQLQLLGGLKKLRALRVVSPWRVMWQYPGQAEIAFMEANWPYFHEFSYRLEGYQGKTRPLDQDRPWQWFKKRRPVLRVLGSRPDLTSEDETESEESL